MIHLYDMALEKHTLLLVGVVFNIKTSDHVIGPPSYDTIKQPKHDSIWILGNYKKQIGSVNNTCATCSNSSIQEIFLKSINPTRPPSPTHTTIKLHLDLLYSNV